MATTHVRLRHETIARLRSLEDCAQVDPNESSALASLGIGNEVVNGKARMTLDQLVTHLLDRHDRERERHAERKRRHAEKRKAKRPKRMPLPDKEASDA